MRTCDARAVVAAGREVLLSPEVLIAGAGPTGLITANLLGQQGIRTLVVERNQTLSDVPKAILIDDEALRTCQAAGLGAAVSAIVLLGYGARYYAANGKCFAKVRPRVSPYGFPRRNSFAQPELERVLLRGIERFEHVEVRFSSSLEDFTQDAGGVSATVREGDHTDTVRAAFLLGCDGGRSTVRGGLGIAMRGSSFAQPWVVVDTVNDPDNGRYTRFFCDPHRPTVSVPGRDGRRRYEFMLLPGEQPEAMLEPERLKALLARHRPYRDADILRKTVYTFHALLAERFQQSRVLLLGDAAHMMPPFAGQGMNAGFRDAHTLAWKVAAVIRGLAGAGCLASYEAERRAHVASMIDLSERLGRIVMTASPGRAWLRDRLFDLVGLIPPLRDYIAEMRFKPLPRCRQGLFIGAAEAARDSLVGAMLPQPRVTTLEGRELLLDDVLGSGFSVLDVGAGLGFAALTHDFWARCGATRIAIARDAGPVPRYDGADAVVHEVGTLLSADCAAHRGRLLLVRPDRYVACAFAPDDADEVADAYARLLDTGA